MAVESGKKVMVAIDESKGSYYTLMWVLENLHETIKKSGNPLVIFMAQPAPNNFNVFSASLGTARMYCNVSSTPDLVMSVQEQNYRVTKGILEKAKGICTSHGMLGNSFYIRIPLNSQSQRKVLSYVLLPLGDVRDLRKNTARPEYNWQSSVLSLQIQAEMLTEVGDARQAICDAVQKYTISLLVLGDHGLGQIKRALLGSVSTYCVQNAKCPVLVVKKPE
ncbi:hypothetical protein RJ640_017971 [Escallonia rubra]|uniref:UspA domain-containing protein n=1 Tax=Escallonia rubra TaxID=112253 RepID=A0AA88RDA0_9ASTE|nr:hypothetical protein RJ640_017971 [Escallonia rubra]